MARNSVAVLQILEVLGRGRALGLSELAAQLSLPKTSVHRALADLMEEGWVRAMEFPVHYFLSGKILRVARGANGAADLSVAAGPVLDRLQNLTQENVQLSTLEDGLVLALERRESTHALRVHLPLGEGLSWHATAVGRAIAGHLPAEQLEQLLSMELPALTPHTTVDRAELRRQIDRAVQDGFVVNRGGWRTGVISIGAAILDPLGAPVGGLSINSVESRMGPEDADALALVVRDAAREISQRLA
jgi:DNA-binding IclR family transcriptional regulator